MPACGFTPQRDRPWTTDAAVRYAKGGAAGRRSPAGPGMTERADRHGADGQGAGGDAPGAEVFIVCGLSQLGRHCVRVLSRTFGVAVHAVDPDPEAASALEHKGLLHRFIRGDGRDTAVLEEAGIRRCRAILLVHSDERINIAAAFAARTLNPAVRLVLRSAQRNLNDLLARSLGNFVAYEPTQLSAAAFALAGMEGDTAGLIRLEGRFLTVFRRTIGPDHPWCGTRRLHDLNSRNRRVLGHAPAGVDPAAGHFHQWDADRQIQAGDTVDWIQADGAGVMTAGPADAPASGVPVPADEAARPTVTDRLRVLWRDASPAKRGILAFGTALALLYVLGVVFFALAYPQIGLHNALNVAMILILGGYQDLFSGLEMPFPISYGLQIFSLVLTVAGTAFIGVVYASLTAQVLGARFTFVQRRPPPPAGGHVVLVGLNKVGRRVAELLIDLRQPVLGVADGDPVTEAPPALPVLEGRLGQALPKARLAAARTVMALTDDEVANLEIALTARAANPACRLVIRTDDPAFSRNLTALVPGARAFGTASLAAEAFAGAAFGEHILDLFHLGSQPVLVTEYRVDAGDTLDGRLLAEVGHGYGITPVLHQDAAGGAADLLPSDDNRLHPGDRLVVLATSEALQRVETGVLLPRTARVRVERALNDHAAFHGAMAIARVAGCEPGHARALMTRLPAALELPLYAAQAQRLVAELGKAGVRARVEALEPAAVPLGSRR